MILLYSQRLFIYLVVDLFVQRTISVSTSNNVHGETIRDLRQKRISSCQSRDVPDVTRESCPQVKTKSDTSKALVH